MKLSSCTHSFALLALSFSTIHFASSLSVDSNAVAKLQPRLDGKAAVPDASSSSTPTRRRKKCKFTKSVSGVALSTGVAIPVITGSPAPTNNVSSLALGNQLSYARSYKTKCSKKTGTAYIPSASSSPESGSGSESSSDSGPSPTGSGTDSTSGSGSSLGSSNTGETVNAGSPATGNNSPGSSPAGSGQPAGSVGVCGPQQTVTVTSQTTVTVTQIAQAADSASATGATAVSESAATAGSKGSVNASSGNSSQGGQAAASSGVSAPMENPSSASASTTAVAGESSSGSPSSVYPSPGSLSSSFPSSDNAGSGNSGLGNVGLGNSGSGNTGNGNSGSGNVGSGNMGSGNTGNGNSGSGNSGSGNSGSGNVGSGNMGSGNMGSGNSGSGNSGSGNAGSGNSGSGNSGSGELGNGKSGSGESASGTSASGVSDHGPYHSNATVSGFASPSGTASSVLSMHVLVAQVDKEKCGTIPTGNMNSFPQYAGYLKAEVITCNDAITAQAFPQPQSVTASTSTANTSGKSCSNVVIPRNLLSQNVFEMLTIMGFSACRDPMTPVDINSESSERATLNRTLTTLMQMMGYAEAYGKYESGPFVGKYKLRALGVEYGTSYIYE